MQITGMLYGARLLDFVGFPASEVHGPDASEEKIKSLIDRHGLIFIKPVFKGGVGKKGKESLDLLKDSIKDAKKGWRLRPSQPEKKLSKDKAKKHSVLMESTQIVGVERRPKVTAASVSFEAKSNWKDLIRFFHELQGPDQFIVIENANIQVDSADKTQVRCRMKVAKWFAK